MSTLGTRIRKLRKQRGLTLEALAGDQLSKGMLSLIENDKAQPSMESLHFIATKLNVAATELIETISLSDLRDLLEKANTAYKQEHFEWILDHLSAPLNETLPSTYETAKLMELYGKASYQLQKVNWDSFLEKADALFYSLNFFNPSAQITFFMVWTKMNDHQYEAALDVLINKKQMFDDNHADLDLLTELDFLYLEITLLFAVGDYHRASERLREAITRSNEKNVLYRIEELYRMAFVYAAMNNQDKDRTFYFDKLTLLVKFTENKQSQFNLMVIEIYYYNYYDLDPDHVLELLEDMSKLDDSEEGLDYFYAMQKGVAWYHKKAYQTALDYFIKFKKHPSWNHPFDLALMYEAYAYKARCYQALGQLDDAQHWANYAWEHIQPLPETPSTAVVRETFEAIKRMGETK